MLNLKMIQTYLKKQTHLKKKQIHRHREQTFSKGKGRGRDKLAWD